MPPECRQVERRSDEVECGDAEDNLVRVRVRVRVRALLFRGVGV